jgi:hypothetical protein
MIPLYEQGPYAIYKKEFQNNSLYIENKHTGIKARAYIGDTGELEIKYQGMHSPYVGFDTSIPLYIRERAMSLLQYIKTLNS